MRILLEYLAPFALPFVVWLLWLRFERWRASLPLADRPVPWLPLAIAGAGLVALSLFAGSLFQGDATNGLYVPAHLEDGKLVPGRVGPK